MTFNQALIEGLFKARNREPMRAETRAWLRQAIRLERLRRSALAQ